MARKPSIMYTTRTKKLFAEHGFKCEIVERTICGIGIRKDFLGGVDQLAMKVGHKHIIGVQSFSTDWAGHYRKIILGEGDRGQATVDEVTFWMKLPYTRMCFIGWRKLKVKRGGKAYRWTPRFGRVKLTKKNVLKLIEVKTFEEAIK